MSIELFRPRNTWCLLFFLLLLLSCSLALSLSPSPNLRSTYNATGLKSISTGNFLGQSTFGSIVCTSRRFKGDEEWEVEEGTAGRLLSMSAGWGAGAFVKFDGAGMKRDGAGDWTGAKLKVGEAKGANETATFEVERVDFMEMGNGEPR